MAVLGITLVLVVGVRLAPRDAPEKTSRSVPTPIEEDGASNARIIDKDQRVDVDTFGRQDSPLWPLVEELRSAAPQDDSTPTGSGREE
ncbi:hypothetical protein GCM10010140_76700 [Streptosporangium pseudovulgare]|uniref:Secreted protein n=1 Tax=Streptosporangium pseudovulgare TaxID=35765 RepID=A0ABQ2RLK3_9ACTN|nr:hypothetical protein GCM10010140_76700 [Streptosporangium pseudovulgare]